MFSPDLKMNASKTELSHFKTLYIAESSDQGKPKILNIKS